MNRSNLLLLSTCLLFAISSQARTAHYEYQVVDPYSSVRLGPFVTNEGAVIWQGSTAIDGTPQAGIFRWNNGQTERLVAQGEEFTSFWRLAVSDNGTIAFTASTETPGRKAFRLDAGGLTEIASFANGAIDAWVQDVNNQGEVLYTALTDTSYFSPNEVHVGTGATDRTLATAPEYGIFFGGTINNHGAVAMAMQTSPGEGNHWMVEPSAEPMLVDTPEGFGFGAPSINDAGDFSAISRLGFNGQGQGVWLHTAGDWQPITNDPTKTYYADWLPTLNNRGQIVARSQAGVEVAPMPREVVFPSGLPLTEIDGLYFSTALETRDLNDRGQVVANLRRATAQGSSLTGYGIVLATPVPEPTSLAFLLGLCATCTVLRRRRRGSAKLNADC